MYITLWGVAFVFFSLVVYPLLYSITLSAIVRVLPFFVLNLMYFVACLLFVLVVPDSISKKTFLRPPSISDLTCANYSSSVFNTAPPSSPFCSQFNTHPHFQQLLVCLSCMTPNSTFYASFNTFTYGPLRLLNFYHLHLCKQYNSSFL
jgi:hypothetical protein